MMINTTEALVGYEGERALELGGRDVRPAVRRRVCVNGCDELAELGGGWVGERSSWELPWEPLASQGQG